MFVSKREFDALVSRVNQLENENQILKERQDLLMNNDVALKQEIDDIQKDNKTQYFG